MTIGQKGDGTLVVRCDGCHAFRARFAPVVDGRLYCDKCIKLFEGEHAPIPKQWVVTKRIEVDGFTTRGNDQNVTLPDEVRFDQVVQVGGNDEIHPAAKRASPIVAAVGTTKVWADKGFQLFIVKCDLNHCGSTVAVRIYDKEDPARMYARSVRKLLDKGYKLCRTKGRDKTQTTIRECFVCPNHTEKETREGQYNHVVLAGEGVSDPFADYGEGTVTKVMAEQMRNDVQKMQDAVPKTAADLFDDLKPRVPKKPLVKTAKIGNLLKRGAKAFE
jgi:hypothetical protein